MAIRNIIDEWMNAGCPLKPAEITLVFHTSCVKYQNEDLDYLYRMGMQWCVPDNVRVELQLLQENGREFGESAFSRRAGIILANAGRCGLLGTTHAGERWDLEQLYTEAGRTAAPERHTLSRGPMLFLFGDRYKMYEFLEYSRGLQGHYVLVLHEGEWSCARGRVASLGAEAESLRVWAKAFWSGSECTPVSTANRGCQKDQLRRIKIHNSRGENLIRGPGLPGSALIDKVGSGQYAVIYRAPSGMDEDLVKLFTDWTLTGSGIEKIRALAAHSSDMNHLPLAMPRLLMMWSGQDPEMHVIGYTMKALEGQPASQIVLIKWPDGSDPKQILRRIGALLVEVHTRGMLVNDLSYNNILVAPDGRVGFVDCDSFQVRGYPGGQITAIYRHRDVCEADCEQMLRKPIHEYFAFTVLMYQLIMGAIDPLNAFKMDPDKKPDWNSTAFPLEWNTTQDHFAGPEIISRWVDQDENTRRLFADVFHFRGSPSIGAILRELDLL